MLTTILPEKILRTPVWESKGQNLIKPNPYVLGKKLNISFKTCRQKQH